jgi:hypothetical protein
MSEAEIVQLKAQLEAVELAIILIAQELKQSRGFDLSVELEEQSRSARETTPEGEISELVIALDSLASLCRTWVRIDREGQRQRHDPNEPPGLDRRKP